MIGEMTTTGAETTKWKCENCAQEVRLGKHAHRTHTSSLIS